MVDDTQAYGKMFHKGGFADGEFVVVSKDEALQNLGGVTVVDGLHDSIWEAKLVVLDRISVQFDMAEVLSNLKE